MDTVFFLNRINRFFVIEMDCAPFDVGTEFLLNLG
jgi:hypothetical protein